MLLSNKNIVILIADYYDELEFWYPYYRMKESKANVTVAGVVRGVYKGKNGMSAQTEIGMESLKADNFDAVIIPGGFAPDFLRREPVLIDFVRRMHEQGKVIAAICHGPWLLASAGILKNKSLTSYFSIKDDLVNAGAYWIDQETVVDDNIITARNPNDLPQFCKTIIELISKN